MATRAENAKLIKDKLQIEIDTSKSDPKADQLQGWADRLESDQEGVRKQVLSWQVQNELDVELAPDSVTAEQLQGWLARAEKEAEAVKAEIAALGQSATQTPGPQMSTPTAQASGQTAVTADRLPVELGQPEQAEMVTVQVTGRTARYGGAYTDPVSKKTIGSEPVTVPMTAFVQGLIEDGTVIKSG